MRRGVGDEVIIFDGAGRYARASIKNVAGKSLDLELLTEETEPAPRVILSLLQAIPKGSNMELIVEKAVELGINHIQPVLTERTVVRLDDKEARKKQEKWQRLALEACKQCGQNWLPSVAVPRPLKEALSNTPPDAFKIVAAIRPDAQPLKRLLAAAGGSPIHHAMLAIGPEGDFSPAEYDHAARCGFHPLSLGTIILRVETAALFAASIVKHELRDSP